jgi:hypothetical protein
LNIGVHPDFKFMRGFGSLLRPSSGIRSIVFIRVAVGLIFFTQGILKFIDPHMA